MNSRLQTRSYIRRQNGSHPVVIWSASDSPFCAATVKLFLRCSVASQDVVLHKLDSHRNGCLIQKELCAMTGHQNNLTIFVNDQYLGGYDSAREAYSTGKLGLLLRRPSSAGHPDAPTACGMKRCKSVRQSPLLRRARSIGNKEGEIMPHKNFVWTNKKCQQQQQQQVRSYPLPPSAKARCEHVFQSVLGRSCNVLVKRQEQRDEKANRFLQAMDCDLKNIAPNIEKNTFLESNLSLLRRRDTHAPVFHSESDLQRFDPHKISQTGQMDKPILSKLISTGMEDRLNRLALQQHQER